jgi:hypothetical protein
MSRSNSVDFNYFSIYFTSKSTYYAIPIIGENLRHIGGVQDNSEKMPPVSHELSFLSLEISFDCSELSGFLDFQTHLAQPLRNKTG